MTDDYLNAVIITEAEIEHARSIIFLDSFAGLARAHSNLTMAVGQAKLACEQLVAQFRSRIEATVPRRLGSDA